MKVNLISLLALTLTACEYHCIVDGTATELEADARESATEQCTQQASAAATQELSQGTLRKDYQVLETVHGESGPQWDVYEQDSAAASATIFCDFRRSEFGDYTAIQTDLADTQKTLDELIQECQDLAKFQAQNWNDGIAWMLRSYTPGDGHWIDHKTGFEEQIFVE